MKAAIFLARVFKIMGLLATSTHRKSDIEHTARTLALA